MGTGCSEGNPQLTSSNVQVGPALGGWGLSQETRGSPCVCVHACRRAADGELTSQPPPPRNDITETPAPADSTQGSWEQEPGTHRDVLATSPYRGGQGVLAGLGPKQTVPHVCLGYVRFAPSGVCRGAGRKYRKYRLCA